MWICQFKYYTLLNPLLETSRHWQQLFEHFCMGKVLLYWSVVQYNNVQEKDRIARKGAMLLDGGAMLPDGYITS